MSTIEAWKVLEPDAYYRYFIEKNRRPDGRPWMSGREVVLNCNSINTADGSATVRIGSTSVVCGIKAELAEPLLGSPESGFVVPNVEIHPCASPRLKAAHPGEEAMNVSQLLNSLIKNSSMIDLKSLCIVPNKFVWCLYCDVVCLNHDGNVADAAVLALVLGLHSLLLPKVTFDVEDERLKVDSKDISKVDVKAMLTSTTFSCYNSEILLLDPCADDEKECKGTAVTIVFKDSHTISLVKKTGGEVVSSADLERLIDAAKARHSELTLLMTKEIAKLPKI